MTTRVTLALAAVLALAACGKVGPPVRAEPTPPPPARAAPAPVSAAPAPASSGAEQCDDPNAVPVEAKP